MNLNYGICWMDWVFLYRSAQNLTKSLGKSYILVVWRRTRIDRIHTNGFIWGCCAQNLTKSIIKYYILVVYGRTPIYRMHTNRLWYDNMSGDSCYSCSLKIKYFFSFFSRPPSRPFSRASAFHFPFSKRQRFLIYTLILLRHFHWPRIGHIQKYFRTFH